MYFITLSSDKNVIYVLAYFYLMLLKNHNDWHTDKCSITLFYLLQFSIKSFLKVFPQLTKNLSHNYAYLLKNGKVKLQNSISYECVFMLQKFRIRYRKLSFRPNHVHTHRKRIQFRSRILIVFTSYCCNG